MKNKYILLFVIGVILLIVGLWFNFKGPILREGLVDTSLVVLGGLGTVSGTKSVYYADSGLTNTPNWRASTGSTYKQISGSNGYIVAVDTGNAVYLGTQFDVTGNAGGFTFKWTALPIGALKYVFFDFPMLVGINTSDRLVYIDNVLSLGQAAVTPTAVAGSTPTKTFKQICAALGNAYAIGTDNKIWYAPDVRKPVWIDVTGTIPNPLQVVYDGTLVGAIDGANNAYYSSVTGGGTSWQLLSSRKMKQISLTNGIAVGVGIDDRVYIAPSIKDNAWVPLTTGAVTMSQVEVFYPANAAVRMQRNTIVSINACSEPGYTEMDADGQCYQPCPSGYTRSFGTCNGVPVPRARNAAVAVPPILSTCASGSPVVTAPATCAPIASTVTGTVPTPLSEVYGVSGQFNQAAADAKCRIYGGALATVAQINVAAKTGFISGIGWTAPTVVGATTGMTASSATSTVSGVSFVSVKTLNVTQDTDAGTRIGALCFGVKPPKNQFTDVLAFKPSGIIASEQWNQAPPCSAGYNVRFNIGCRSACNLTSYTEDPNTCIGKTIPKVATGPARTEQWICPTGFSFNGADTTTCYSNCPANYVASGATCVPATTVRSYGTSDVYARTSSQRLFHWALGFYCPAGTTEIANTCYANCLAGETTTSLSFGGATAYICIRACPSTRPIRNTDNTCSSACPTGYNVTNNTTCTFIGTNINRTTTPRIWQTACDAGQTKGVDNQCYRNGCVGLTIPGTTTTTVAADSITETIDSCKINNLTRTTGAAPTLSAATFPCDMSKNEYVKETNECVTLCAATETQTATTCTPTTRTTGSKPVGVVCNANEESINGICVSKCPAGTYAKGELCVSEKTVVAMPASVSKCIATPYGNYKKWLCDKSSDDCTATCEAAKLLKDPTNETTYVDPNDQVCVSDDPTLKMYYCERGEVAKMRGPSAGDARDSYDSTCDNLVKNYTDLSGALNTIATIKEDMLYGKTTIGGARDSLQSVHRNLCSTVTPANTSICSKITAGISSIGGDHDAVNQALNSAIAPIQQALDSRNFLRDQLYKFKCKNYTTPPAFSV
jgi:hypothetical protein